MKKINPYLLAFFAILVHSLVYGMTLPEVLALGLLLTKLSFDSYLDRKVVDSTEQFRLELKGLKEKLTQVDNLAKSLNTRR